MAPAAILAVLLSRPVWDVDIFWQLRLGEMILAHGGSIGREPFAASHIGEPLPAIAWLGQAVMALVRRLGGWDALRMFDALCWLGGFWAVAAACRVRGAAPGAVLLGLFLAMVAAISTASIRPQSFAVLCFGLLLGLLRLELRPLTTAVLAAPLLVLWQNFHPSVSVGAVALAVSAGAGWYDWRRNGQPAPLAATVLVPVALAAMFATPDGIGVLAVSARNAEASVNMNVREWLPIWTSSHWRDSLPILFAAAVAVWGVARNSERTRLTELAVAVALFALTLVTIRFVLFWAVALVPVVSRAAGEPLTSLEQRAGNLKRDPLTLSLSKGVERSAALASFDRLRTSGVGARFLQSALAMLAVALVLPAVRPTHFDETLPMAAIERLKQEDVSGVIYADFPYGGPIIDAGYPDWRVAYDGRYYRYTPEEWRFNGGVEAGTLGLRDILGKWSVAGFLLKVSHNAPLARELARAPGWKRIWDRDGIVVYVPAERPRSFMPRA